MPLTITCDNPPDGFVGVEYLHTFPASDGTEPYVFEITDGELPDGLDLDADTGVVSGIPTDKGRSDFTIQVTDDDAVSTDADCSIRVVGNCLVEP